MGVSRVGFSGRVLPSSDTGADPSSSTTRLNNDVSSFGGNDPTAAFWARQAQPSAGYGGTSSFDDSTRTSGVRSSTPPTAAATQVSTSQTSAATGVDYSAAGLTPDSKVTTPQQMQAVYDAVVAAGVANGVIPANFVPPDLTQAAVPGTDGMNFNLNGSGQYGDNTINYDPSNLTSPNMTASDVAASFAHELGHAADPDFLDEDPATRESVADALSVQITQDPQAAVNMWGHQVADAMAEDPDLSAADANVLQSDANHGTPYERAVTLMGQYGGTMPSNLLNIAVTYDPDTGDPAGSYVYGGQIEPVPTIPSPITGGLTLPDPSGGEPAGGGEPDEGDDYNMEADVL